MRLTCPNCGAQYEVPDNAIPDGGRDVQCSNCGHTWFEEPRSAGADPVGEDAAAAAAAIRQSVQARSGPAPTSPPAPDAQPEPEPDHPAAEELSPEPEPDVEDAPEAEPPMAEEVETEASEDDLPPPPGGDDDTLDRVSAALASGDSRPEDPSADEPPADDAAAAEADADDRPADEHWAEMGSPAPGNPDDDDNADQTWPHDPGDPAAEDRSSEETAAAAEPEQEPDPAAGAEDDADEQGEGEDRPSFPPHPADRARRPVDPDVASILQEEAALEKAARERERTPLESQPDLGLDSAAADSPAPRTPDPAPVVPPAAIPTESPQARRDLLPDIDEINSSLRSEDDRTGEPHDTDPPERRQKRGFRTGFVGVIVIAALGVAAYVFGDEIGEQVPQLAGPMAEYENLVDDGRLWLDSQMRALIDRLSQDSEG